MDGTHKALVCLFWCGTIIADQRAFLLLLTCTYGTSESGRKECHGFEQGTNSYDVPTGLDSFFASILINTQ